MTTKQPVKVLKYNNTQSAKSLVTTTCTRSYWLSTAKFSLKSPNVLSQNCTCLPLLTVDCAHYFSTQIQQQNLQTFVDHDHQIQWPPTLWDLGGRICHPHMAKQVPCTPRARRPGIVARTQEPCATGIKKQFQFLFDELIYTASPPTPWTARSCDFPTSTYTAGTVR